MLTRKIIFASMFVLILATGYAQAGGDPIRGKELTGDCADCHGEDGMGNDEFPQLAGLEEAYFVEQLTAFKTGERVDENEFMPMYSEDLSDQDIADLAVYYSALATE
jgi:cytochrome c553